MRPARPNDAATAYALSVDLLASPQLGHVRPRSVAVIGAGPAGLVSAARLHAAGVEVTVFEKSRGIGGRVATRRTSDGLAFDHGTQFVTARGESFSRFLEEAQGSGSAERWVPVVDPPRMLGSVASAENGVPHTPSDWYVGKPGMSSLFRSLISGVTVRHSITVTHVDPTDRGIWLTASEPHRGSRRIGAFDAAIVAIPAPQALAITGHLPSVADTLARVVIAPCWALLLGIDGEPAVFADVYRRTNGPIAWVARDSSKPGRPNGIATLVAHASAQWSRDHLEDSPEAVASRLLDELHSLLGEKLPAPGYGVAHRWRFAQTEVPLGSPFVEVADGRVLIGGDWTTGARVEAAWDSGEAMARRLLRH